jgi:hypothetical protein
MASPRRFLADDWVSQRFTLLYKNKLLAKKEIDDKDCQKLSEVWISRLIQEFPKGSKEITWVYEDTCPYPSDELLACATKLTNRQNGVLATFTDWEEDDDEDTFHYSRTVTVKFSETETVVTRDLESIVLD